LRLPLFFVAVAASLALVAPAVARADDQEAAIGDQIFAQLDANNEIVLRPNPLYNVLDPIAAQIKTIADPQYAYRFSFIIVNDMSANAYAAPGGNVYVTEGLFGFVQNREEFASVLCHEAAHDIDHDLIHSVAKDQRLATLIGLIGAFSGAVKSARGLYTENLAYALQVNSYAFDVENVADTTGADICAEAGFNPWGMIWLFENNFRVGTGASMEALSDPISQQHRISNLEAHFEGNPQLFGAYSSNGASARALSP
jgi:predicted Zn-dependent protease